MCGIARFRYSMPPLATVSNDSVIPLAKGIQNPRYAERAITRKCLESQQVLAEERTKTVEAYAGMVSAIMGSGISLAFGFFGQSDTTRTDARPDTP
jgi:hypothetical protein